MFKKKIRPDLIKLINKKIDCKIQLFMQVIINSTKYLNDKRHLCIKTKNVHDINELFDLMKEMYGNI